MTADSSAPVHPPIGAAPLAEVNERGWRCGRGPPRNGGGSWDHRSPSVRRVATSPNPAHLPPSTGGGKASTVTGPARPSPWPPPPGAPGPAPPPVTPDGPTAPDDPGDGGGVAGRPGGRAVAARPR